MRPRAKRSLKEPSRDALINVEMLVMTEKTARLVDYVDYQNAGPK